MVRRSQLPRQQHGLFHSAVLNYQANRHDFQHDPQHLSCGLEKIRSARVVKFFAGCACVPPLKTDT